jgi:hypothetical protein
MGDTCHCCKLLAQYIFALQACRWLEPQNATCWYLSNKVHRALPGVVLQPLQEGKVMPGSVLTIFLNGPS